MTRLLLLSLSLLLPLGYAQAASDNAKGKAGSNMSMNELQNASQEDLAKTFGNAKATEIHDIIAKMQEHQQALVQLRKQLAKTTGNSELAKEHGDKPEKGKSADSDKDKSKDKNKDKNKSKGKPDSDDEG